MRAINELEEARDELIMALKSAKKQKEKKEIEAKIKEIKKLLKLFQDEIGLDPHGLRRIIRLITTGKKISDQAKHRQKIQ